MKKIYYGKAVYNNKEINAVINVLRKNLQKLIVKLTYKNLDVESQETNLGYNSFNYFIKNKIKIDAIFCTNDLLALGCYQAIKETNLNIPNDISIIGYDNSQIATNIK